MAGIKGVAGEFFGHEFWMKCAAAARWRKLFNDDARKSFESEVPSALEARVRGHQFVNKSEKSEQKKKRKKTVALNNKELTGPRSRIATVLFEQA